MTRCIPFLLCSLLFFLTEITTAQQIVSSSDEEEEPEEPIRVGSHYSILPVIGYSSDLGFVGGGYVQRLNYGNNVRPFKNNLQADISFSTKGNIVSEISFEQLTTFGLPIRSRLTFIGGRLKETNYFGIGNETDFSDQHYEDGYYFFEARELYINYLGRYSLFEWAGGNLDAVGTITFWRMNPISRSGETLFGDQYGTYDISWLNRTGVGIIADSRDSEFHATEGFYYDIQFETTVPFLGSDYKSKLFKADIRHFLEPFRNVVIAHNLRMDSITGSEKPFWSLPFVGGKEGVRGYHLERFRGDKTIMSLLEIRTWLFTLFEDQVSVGAQAFWDSGRVFSHEDSNALFSDWKHGFGGGMALSLFGPDMIFRGDIGFSKESFRIYFGTGYTF